MKPEDTLYEVLEISPHASQDVVKAAYRCLAQIYHPDKNAVNDSARATLKLVVINHAYAILSDPVARQIYDRKMGFNNHKIDRRNACGAQHGAFAAAGPRASATRPFGFRPL
ncbi:MAG: J domain-containing protein [Candidatus Saccharibacteria bacterium]|nr:J domain-containing protein [Rhodoferax sp.]